MADTRQSKRTPVTLKIKFKSETLEQFIDRYAVDVSHGGIFIRTKDPLPVGTTMKFEFQLKDASPLIKGEGTVVWTREHDPSRTGVAPGMGVRFDRLADGSREVLDQILTRKAGKASASTGFTDMPTRVAPSPLVADLARESQTAMSPMGSSSFTDDRDGTPLPSATPFHSDADEFPDEAFEEATKVRSLEDLAALSASADMDLASITAALTGSTSNDLLDDPAVDPAIDDHDDFDEPTRHRADSEGPTRILGGPRLPDTSGETEAEPVGKSTVSDRAETVPFEGDSATLDLAMAGGADDDRAAQPAEPDEPDAPSADAVGDDERAETSVFDPADEDADAPRDAAPAPPPEPAPESPDEPDAQPVDELAARRATRTTDNDATDDDAKATDAAKTKTTAKASESTSDRPPSKDDEDKATAVVSALPATEEKRERDQTQSSGKGGAPWALIILALVILSVAGGYFMLTRNKGDDNKANQTEPTTPVAAIDAAPTPPPIDAAAAPPVVPDAGVPDAGVPDATAMVQPDPDAKLVEVQIRSVPSRATAELVGTGKSGETPISFQMAEGTSYTVRVSKDQFQSQEITVEAASGVKVPRVRLKLIPMVLRLTSEPTGALIYVNGRRVKGRTPTTFELPATFRTKKTLKISMRLPRHKKLDFSVSTSGFKLEGEQLLLDANGALVPGTSPKRNTDGGSSTPDKPADTPADKPADTPADKPADTPADKPADTPADKPADTPPAVTPTPVKPVVIPTPVEMPKPAQP